MLDPNANPSAASKFTKNHSLMWLAAARDRYAQPTLLRDGLEQKGNPVIPNGLCIWNYPFWLPSFRSCRSIRATRPGHAVTCRASAVV
jgi:hypothetical protein